jgi:sigma-B regulation protein RsbU (phosphoserine phosphatase)
VNERFYSVFAGHSIMSACCLIVHPDGRVLFANAGHPPLLIKRVNGAIEAITERETMLGIHEHLKFTDACTTIESGETALLFTDGLHSLLDHNGRRMEESAVRSVFGNIHVSDRILDDLSNGIKAMSDGGPFLDDVAAISIQRCRG